MVTCFLMAFSNACSTWSLNLSLRLLILASVSSLGYIIDKDLFKLPPRPVVLAPSGVGPPAGVGVLVALGILIYLNWLNSSSMSALHFFHSSLIAVSSIALQSLFLS